MQPQIVTWVPSHKGQFSRFCIDALRVTDTIVLNPKANDNVLIGVRVNHYVGSYAPGFLVPVQGIDRLFSIMAGDVMLVLDQLLNIAR